MKRYFRLIFTVSIIGLIFFSAACKGNNASPSPPQAAAPAIAVTEIQSEEEFKKIIEQPNQLMVFDLYADWCGPCKVLSPLLEEIGRENKDKAAFYKINVDRHRGLAALFKVRGIPYVVFLKNKTIIYALTGLYPKDAYVKVINRLSEKGNEELVSKPDGEIVNGIRVIRFSAGINPRSLYVFRGETVKIIIDKQGYPFSVHLPDFGVSGEAGKDMGLEVTFKAKKVGVFPIFCNGNCPAGDGALHGKIIVMQYKAEDKAVFEELTARDAGDLIKNKNPLILDVRTPKEFYSGHLPGAKLIPLQQLSERLSEIQQYKDSEILIYCRSGNRSTVAGEIMIENGFKKIYHLRSGILGWLEQGFKIEKEQTGMTI